jgi:hypothetical protein
VSNSFLESVLPSQGKYCAVAIDDRAPDKSKAIRGQYFVDTLDELQHTTEQITGRSQGAFFALATFNDNESRKADDALYLRSLFLDIDCGPTKHYPDAAAGAKALRAFIDKHKLPRPFVVSSGRGLHVYWPMDCDVTVAEWRPMAKALKDLCLTDHLAIDPACTSDAARVLRMPGSTHFKGDPAPVQLMIAGVVSAPATLAARLPAVQPAVDLSAAKAFASLDDATKSLTQGSDRKPSKFHLIIERKACAQMSYCAENAAVLEEPMWRAGLSVAWNCTDAETAIRAVSEGHPEYDYDKTLEKAQRLTDKPYTCSWFRENYPSRCDKCKQKVTSPIQLGTYIEEAETNEDGEYEVDTEYVPDEEAVAVRVKIPELPAPYFRAAAGGIFMRVRNGDGEELEPMEIYPRDLYISGRFYDSDEHGDGEGELVAINLHLPHDGLRRFHVPVTHLMATDKLREVLVKHGVVAYGKKLGSIMAYLAESIKKLQSKYASNKTRNQMGWTPEGNFVVGELEYTPSGVTLAPAASGTRQLAPLFHARGSVEGWRNVIDFYNRPGMEGHAFGFLVGLGSPLLKLLNSTQVRGAVVNLVSNGSGTGKTTVQMAINSIFGHPTELLMEAKDTAASRFHRLGTLNSICMTVDELTNASGEELSKLVYGSTSGRAPHRMEASSNKLRSNQTTWCSVTVTSSNAVMADALAAHKVAVEGELKRVIDLPVNIPSHIPKAESDALFSQLADHYGVAGPVFIQHAVANREAIEEALRQMQLRIDREAGFERNDRFYSAVCTLAMVAGIIGNKLGLFDLDLKRIYAYAIKTISGIRDQNATTVGDAHTMATELLSKYIGENINNTLLVNRGKPGEIPAAPVMPRGQLKMRYEPDTDELIIPVSDLRDYFVNRRVDFKASLMEFQLMGALVLGPKNDTSVVRRIAAGAVGALAAPPTRCYVFKCAKLGLKVEVPPAEAAQV